MRKLLAALLAATMLVLSLSACTAKSDYSFEGSVDALNSSKDSIGSLGDFNSPVEIYTYFFNYYKATQENMLIQFGYTEEDLASYWTMDQDGSTMYDMLEEQALIVSKEFSELLVIVKQNNITLTDEEIKASTDEIDSQVASLGTGADAKATFENLTGLKIEQMKVMNVLFSLVSKYTDSIAADIVVSDEEIEAYYNENSSSYEMAVASHVLIGLSEEMTDEEREAAKTKADEVLAMLNDGTKTMAELAAEYSEDPGSKDTGGEYTFSRGDMVAEFEDWAFNATAGDTGIVETTYGYHVMQSGGLQMESLETVSAEIIENLKGLKVDEIMTAAVAALGLEWTVNEDVLDKVNSTLKK